MNVGMLWFDNDSKTALEKKIERAVTYYQTKYGKAPTLCFVHPSMLPTEAQAVEGSPAAGTFKSGGVEVRPTRTVLPHHFWIGINGVNGSSGGAD